MIIFLSLPLSFRGIQIEDDYWKQILTNNTNDQFRIAENIRNRQKLRNKKIEQYETGQPHNWTDPRAPGDCQAV